MTSYEPLGLEAHYYAAWLDTQPELMHVSAVAKKMGVCSRTITKRIRDGRIEGKKLGNEWRISKRSFLEWVKLGDL